MKQWGKTLVKKAFRKLPQNMQRSLFADVADRLGFCAVKVVGDLGVIQGTPEDLVVLAVYARTGNWADRTNALLTNFFEQRGGGTYIDVGANIGLTTIPVARNPNVTVHAFEPEPRNFGCLTENIRVNCPHANVTLHNVALYERDDTLTFELSPRNSGDHRIRLGNALSELGEDQWEVVTVDATPLDELVSDPVMPLAVKIDTQGAEPFVICGGRNVLSAADLIVLEFAPYWMNRMGSDPGHVLAFLESFPSIQIAKGERADIGASMTGSEAVKQLQNMCASDDPKDYWDIIARRTD